MLLFLDAYRKGAPMDGPKKRHNRSDAATADADNRSRMKETDHRVANSLAFLGAMLRHEGRGITTSESARAAIEDAANRLAAMASVHRGLTDHADDSAVDLAEVLDPLCADIAASLAVVFETRWNGWVASAYQASQIGIIINELAMNAMKHGGHKGRPVVVSVTAEQLCDGRLSITIRDNGAGLPEGFDLATTEGLGMTIVTSTIEKLHGTMRVLEDGDGAGFEFRLLPSTECSASFEETEDQ